MRRYIVSGVSCSLIAGLLFMSVFAWVYPDGSADNVFERYGPRAGRLMIHLYESMSAEFDALKNGEIDMTDLPLSRAYYDEFTQAPYNETIQVVNYGPEFGVYILDLNSNNNQYLGNPPDPDYPNPVADNNDSIGNHLIKEGDGAANNHNPMSSVYMRRAIAYVVDRQRYISDPAIGVGFGYPMYTTMPPALEKYLLDVCGDPAIPWAWEYNPAAANATLEEGRFKINLVTGYRYWDLDDDDFEDPDEWVELIFHIRCDHPGRMSIGDMMVTALDSIGIRVYVRYNTESSTFREVMVEKNFHMYTGGWNLGVDPDHLILWSWDYYWHPGFCYNYGGHNDPEFNMAADSIMTAANQTEAVERAMIAQYRQAYSVLGIPLYTTSGNKAYYRTNVGNNPEDATEGEAWDGVVNVAGSGIDNIWSLTNMHTRESPSSSDTVIDMGFNVPRELFLNPVYSCSSYDWYVLNMIYESLLVRNASDQGELIPWLITQFQTDLYSHPTYGECTRFVFTLRDDVKWSDGMPLTVADIHFSLVELWDILTDRGYPPPCWWSHQPLDCIVAFNVLDAFRFELLLDAKSYWALGIVGGATILPKHIWKPIVETGDPMEFQPDPAMVGTGPFRLIEYNPVAGYILMDVNPIFHRGIPISSQATVNTEGKSKFTPEDGGNLTLTLQNLCMRGAIDDLDINLTIEYPNQTQTMRSYTNLTMASGTKLSLTIPVDWHLGLYKIEVSLHGYSSSDGHQFHHDSLLTRVYVTRKEDIAGSTYYDDIDLQSHPYKDQLPTPDFKVDMKDIGRAAKAFGSYPGHERWSSIADINDDYKVDMRDIGGIAREFGWIS